MNPTEHDAPLIRLLSIKENPLVAEMTQEQLTDLVQKLRQPHHSKPPTKPRQTKAAKEAAYQAILDTL